MDIKSDPVVVHQISILSFLKDSDTIKLVYLRLTTVPHVTFYTKIMTLSEF